MPSYVNIAAEVVEGRRHGVLVYVIERVLEVDTGTRFWHLLRTGVQGTHPVACGTAI